MNDRKHSVYRAYDENGKCLYVGITGDLRARRAHHRQTSEWFRDAVRCVITGPMDKESASVLEIEEIRRLAPAYNIDGTDNERTRKWSPTESDSAGDLLTAKEIADELGVSRATVMRMMPDAKKGKAGILQPAQRLPGNTGAYLFHRSDVERIKARGRTFRSYAG